MAVWATKMASRTYSADAPLTAGLLVQMRGPEEEAYANQKLHGDLPLTLTEKDRRITKTRPVPNLEIPNPNRTYSADSPLYSLTTTYPSTSLDLQLWKNGDSSF